DYSNEDDNTDDEYDKSEMNEEGQGVGVSFDKFAAEFSPDSSTSTKLKLLLSSLTDTSLSEELRLSKPYVYHDISNYLFNNLYGVPSTFED
ncbi:hypothetical protein U2075_14720, partial [Listeria monocytogenes]|uniref:hypothetical protein n=1 Tax=Listeria monocytogenes TaxID=1639 RepID=UPI002FDB9BE0